MDSDKGLRFGLNTTNDWLNKARRELIRLQEADGPDKIDHAINVAITISQTGDWCFNQALDLKLVEDSERPNFLDSARKASLETAILTDISNSNKHYKLTRKPASTVVSVSEGQVVISKELLFSHFSNPNEESSKRNLKAVRTVIEDDEIIRFEYIMGDHRVLTDKGYLSFELTCSEAIKFWEEASASIAKNVKPNWLK